MSRSRQTTDLSIRDVAAGRGFASCSSFFRKASFHLLEGEDSNVPPRAADLRFRLKSGSVHQNEDLKVDLDLTALRLGLLEMFHLLSGTIINKFR